MAARRRAGHKVRAKFFSRQALVSMIRQQALLHVGIAVAIVAGPQKRWR
jgi:hypothetical protein